MLKTVLSTGEKHWVKRRFLYGSSTKDLHNLSNLMAIGRKRNQRLTTKVNPVLFSLMDYNPHRVGKGNYRPCRFLLRNIKGPSDQSSGSISNQSLSFKTDLKFYKPMAHNHFVSMNMVKEVHVTEMRVLMIVRSHEILGGFRLVVGYVFGYSSQGEPC